MVLKKTQQNPPPPITTTPLSQCSRLFISQIDLKSVYKTLNALKSFLRYQLLLVKRSQVHPCAGIGILVKQKLVIFIWVSFSDI